MFPLPPFNNTVILEPLETNVEKYKALYKEVQNNIDSIYDMENAENVTFDELLHNVVEINEDKYIKVIRSSLNGPKVFPKRKPSELRVNPYMKVVLSAWKEITICSLYLTPMLVLCI